MRSPAFLASLIAAFLALVPAVIRLYESMTTDVAALWLYLAWLFLWILTASALLWTGFGETRSRLTRLGILGCGLGMLFALVMTVGAGPAPVNTVAAVLATLGHLTTAAGAAICLLYAPKIGRFSQASWGLAVLGGLILATAAALMLSSGPQAFGQLGLPGGTFLLGAGLSLGLGQFGESVTGPNTGPDASQEP